MFIEKIVSFLLLTLLGGWDKTQYITTTHSVQPGEKIRLPSGVEFEVLQEPSTYATMPSYGTAVRVNYANVGDAHDAGTKIGRLGCGQFLKGIDEGVLTMRVGEKRRLYIPDYLAYGTKPMVYDVQLLDFQA